MKTLYIVSVDLVGSGCDELLPDLQTARIKEQEFVQHLQTQRLKGYVTLCYVEVEDDDFQHYLDYPTDFFDADDHSARKQISRTNINWSEHKAVVGGYGTNIL